MKIRDTFDPGRRDAKQEKDGRKETCWRCARAFLSQGVAKKASSCWKCWEAGCSRLGLGGWAAAHTTWQQQQAQPQHKQSQLQWRLQQ